MYWDCAQIARGDWLMFANDDMIFELESKGWDEELVKVPLDKFVVTARINRFLGFEATWDWRVNPHHTAHFPIVPNKFWERYGLTEFGTPLDTWTLNFLAGKGHGGRGVGMGWKVHPLQKLVTRHDKVKDRLFVEQGRESLFGTNKDGKLLGFDVP
jgi:hypothetical protein